MRINDQFLAEPENVFVIAVFKNIKLTIYKVHLCYLTEIFY